MTPAGPLQIFRGYADDELALFDRFAGRVFAPEPGFITDFLGVRTRASFLAHHDAPDGVVLGLPVPTDNVHAEAVEWIGLLKSVVAARGPRFVAMELGAGWGPWLVAASACCRHAGFEGCDLTGVEADPGHVAFLRAHFLDNGLDPGQHRIHEAAVGLSAGRARWPVCPDPAAEWGLRPVADPAAVHDHLGRPVAVWRDVEVIDLRTLLESRPSWNLVHMDVQGSEADLCEGTSALLAERVHFLVVGTHDPMQHARVIETMHACGWWLENEKPPRLRARVASASIQALTEADGTLVWSNPRFA